MFDIGWSELMIIAVLAIVVVGPRDLPRMMKTVGEYVSKLRRMSREFQSQFDQAVRDADLEDVRKTMTDIKSGNPISEIRDAVKQPFASVADDLKNTAKEIEDTADAAGKPAADDAPATPQGEAPPAAAAITAAATDSGAKPAPAKEEAAQDAIANGDAAPVPAPVAVAAKPEPEPAPVKTAANS